MPRGQWNAPGMRPSRSSSRMSRKSTKVTSAEREIETLPAATMSATCRVMSCAIRTLCCVAMWQSRRGCQACAGSAHGISARSFGQRGYSFPHARALLDHIPKPFVKFDNAGICGPDLQVDLGAPHRAKPLLRCAHEGSPDALAAARFQDGHCIKSTSVPVVARHYGANRPISIGSDKGQLRLHGELRRDGGFGLAPRRVVGKGLLPKGFDALEILRAVRRNMEFGHSSSPSDFKLKHHPISREDRQVNHPEAAEPH